MRVAHEGGGGGGSGCSLRPAVIVSRSHSLVEDGQVPFTTPRECRRHAPLHSDIAATAAPSHLIRDVNILQRRLRHLAAAHCRACKRLPPKRVAQQQQGVCTTTRSAPTRRWLCSFAPCVAARIKNILLDDLTRVATKSKNYKRPRNAGNTISEGNAKGVKMRERAPLCVRLEWPIHIYTWRVSRRIHAADAMDVANETKGPSYVAPLRHKERCS